MSPAGVWCNFHGIERVSDLIERCLAVRREIRELEVLAVKSIADYELFTKTSVIDQESDILKLLESARVAEKGGQDKAVSEFGTATPLTSGFGPIALGRSQGLAAEINTADRLTQLIKDRWLAVTDYQSA